MTKFIINSNLMSISEQDKEMQELFDGFLIETQELLESISNDLMVLENNCDDIELLNKLFRSFHTIKGTSSFIGVESMSNITHHAEDILNKLRRSELKANLKIIDVLLEVHDWLKLLLDRVKANNFELVDYSKTIETLEELNNCSDSEKLPKKDTNEIINIIDVEIKNDQFSEQHSALEEVLNNTEMVKKPGDFTNEEITLIDSAFDEVNKQFYLDMITESNYLNEIKSESKESENKLAFTEQNYTNTQESEKNGNGSNQNNYKEDTQFINGNKVLHDAKNSSEIKVESKSTSDTIRIDVNRVEALMNLSGELVLGRNRLSQISDSIETENCNKDLIRELLEATAQIDFVTSEIQTAVMRMRMVPIAKLYQKAPRIVRELSKEFSKKINLIVKGEETEIDRGIIEELNNPLVHLLRNSCDHGIESPEERIAKGKPAEGNIILDAEQEGNAIVIKITDDGKGLDAEKILSKAIEKEFITQEQATQMTKREIFQLIFKPGFSTASVVTNVSGRGVGMDVVKTNIQQLKGFIDIESEEDKFTTFTIKLPLTLAIIQGLLVKVENDTFAIPLSSVIEVVALNGNSIYSINHKEVIRLREDILPLVKMDKFLNLKNLTKSSKNQYIVVVGIGLMRVGLIVDELLGQQEIVIKALGEYLGNIKGLAGSTILGDGKVIMIIDVPELVELSFSNTELLRFSA
ncbi:MAG TPA: chemotaxis protein CheA [Candidatus Kapabacteria bacterium]|nr:chemotaxis protein CheA [Candidatus Kapabacteria bacterium]